VSILVINFQLNGIGEAEYREYVDKMAPAFIGIPGLIAKAWLADTASNTFGGIYFFDGREAAEAYLASEIVAGIRANPTFANLTTRMFDTIESATAVTQGRLVPAPAVI
jgi:hypothetical protein